MNGENTDTSNFLRVATCGRVIGLKGEISLWPISNVQERYELGATFFTDTGNELTISSIRFHKDHYVVRFEDKNSREDVENLVNEVLYAPELNEDVLEDGEFFAHDVIGKKLIDQNSIERGTVKAFIENAASDLMETQTGDLVPFTFITKVDEAVHIDAPDGLFEINGDE